MLYLTAGELHIAPNRQRQEFDPAALSELSTSIQQHGLMHPIVVRELPEPLETGEKYQLIAGERRFRAIQAIYDVFNEQIRCGGKFCPVGDFPCLLLGDLTELQAEEAELDENLARRDLSWQEHAAAVERLHTLRQRQKDQAFDDAAMALNAIGAPITGQPLQQTVSDTALEVAGTAQGFQREKVRQELIVAKHLDDPEVAGAATIGDAFKILKAKETRQENEARAAALGGSLAKNLHSIFHGSCLPWMQEYIVRAGDNSATHPLFDIICTDPPYGMNAHKFGDAAGKMKSFSHHYDDSYEAWLDLMQHFIPYTWHITKFQAHMYLFCDFDRFHELKKLCESVGWYVFRTPLIYVKTGGGRVPLPERGPRRCYELCLYAIKGDKPVTHIYPDVIQAASDAAEGHGAQKAVAVYQNLLQRSVRPGDMVLDPFAGTGTILPAAQALKCRATCLEQSAEYFGMLAKRMESM